MRPIFFGQALIVQDEFFFAKFQMNHSHFLTNSFEEPQFNTPPAAAKEDGGSLGWWILGGAIAILTLGVGAKFLKK